MSFKYFSGFSLKNEEELFSEYIIKNDFTVCGFSYGAIKAFEEVLNSSERVDLLQLFSPAFFQTKSEKFLRMQLMFFKKDSNAYSKNFLENISKPSSFSMDSYFTQGSYEELEELLKYKWQIEKLNEVLNKGVKIEIFLGEKDEIIDTKEASSFFKEFATVYYIKDIGHILKGNK